MQFCKRFLWFSKSIKNDICSALTLVRSSIEHKHWKLLVGKEDIKIPSPRVLVWEILLPCAMPAWSWATWYVSEFFSLHWLGAAPGCCRDKTYIFIMVCLSYALQNYILRLEKRLSLTGWGTWPFKAEGLVNAVNLIQGMSYKTAYVPTGPSYYLLFINWMNSSSTLNSSKICTMLKPNPFLFLSRPEQFQNEDGDWSPAPCSPSYPYFPEKLLGSWSSAPFWLSRDPLKEDYLPHLVWISAWH